MRAARKYGLLLFLGLLIALFGISNSIFIGSQNLLNILDQVSIIGIIALGMTLVILTGGIDLSVGSIVAFTGIVFAESLVHGFGFPASFALCIASGMLLGGVNGFLIAYGNLPAFIVTLGLMSAVRGASLILTDGRSVSALPNGFNSLANYSVLGISTPAFLFLLLALMFWLLMKFTYWGKFIYATGGNEKAAWLSGIETQKYKLLVYVVTGFVCAVSSVILVCKLESAQPQAGNMYELNAIAAVVIGGASLSGGKGSIIGTFFGVLVLGVLQNGFSILNISSYYQQMLLGAIIIAAVYLDKKSLEVR